MAQNYQKEIEQGTNGLKTLKEAELEVVVFDENDVVVMSGDCRYCPDFECAKVGYCLGDY